MVEIEENDETLFLKLQKMRIHFCHIDTKKFLKQKNESLVEQKINIELTEKTLFYWCLYEH
jgi:hypothetical protein